MPRLFCSGPLAPPSPPSPSPLRTLKSDRILLLSRPSLSYSLSFFPLFVSCVPSADFARVFVCLFVCASRLPTVTHKQTLPRFRLRSLIPPLTFPVQPLLVVVSSILLMFPISSESPPVSSPCCREHIKRGIHSRPRLIWTSSRGQLGRTPAEEETLKISPFLLPFSSVHS